ncbi:glycoside hydrolase family 76 protein [Favolaschia claudopus]|uniref:Glycoside hydrolase family 76 protein n=1 Tax=Favolaschia claudopus TaxID=2862362 RepID=A0AAW0DL46_9AGAR
MAASLVALVLAGYGAAQSASPSWRNPNITTSFADRVSLSEAALNAAVDRLSGGGQFNGEQFGFPGNLYSQMAQFDIATNQTKYQSTVDQYLTLVSQSRKNFTDTYVSTNYGLNYGYAAAKAYQAYHDSKFLDYAVQSWWFGRTRTITQDVLDAGGKLAAKNFTVTQVCKKATMLGAVMWDSEVNEPSIAGIATGSFLILSATLAEATSDPVYLQAATNSADFIRTQLYNPRNIVQPFMSARQNTTGCQIAGDIDPTDSGLMIEGLSILYSITKDATTQNLLSDLLVAAIPNSIWQDGNGVLDYKGGGSLNLVQGLGAAYARNATNSTLHQYIGAYLGVQFNAVTQLATSDGTNIYGKSWSGPPTSTFSGRNQTFALGALLSAIPVGSPSDPSSSPPSSSPPPSSPKSKTSTGAIVGGVIGGLLAIAAVVALLWFLRRRRGRRGDTSPLTIEDSPQSAAVLQPFLGVPSSNDPPSTKDYGSTVPAASIAASISGSASGFGGSTSTSSQPPLPAVVSSQSRQPQALQPKRRAQAPSTTSPPLDTSPSISDMRSVNTAPVAAAPANPRQDSGDGQNLPTEQLVRLLNQRLQNRQWDEEERPPDYM